MESYIAVVDSIAHVAYGVTACSRSGWAGGRTGYKGQWWHDHTVWWAAGFSVLPDLLSMGIPFALFLIQGAEGNFFRDIDVGWLRYYRGTHSLLSAAVGVGLVACLSRRLVVPALAYPLHVIGDALTHAEGKFHAPLFFPLSTWNVGGVPWWRHPEVVIFYWVLLVTVWGVLVYVRYRSRRLNRER